MNERDQALEEAAALCDEGMGFLRWSGVMAKRKRDRELAEARNAGYDAAAKDMAQRIRRMKTGASLSREAALRNLIGNSRIVSGRTMLEALAFAEAGLVSINVLLPLGENSIPPRCEYQITLTKKGEAFLAAPSPPALPGEG